MRLCAPRIAQFRLLYYRNLFKIHHGAGDKTGADQAKNCEYNKTQNYLWTYTSTRYGIQRFVYSFGCYSLLNDDTVL